MLFQLLKDELRIVTLVTCLRIHLYLDMRRDTFVLDSPMSIGREEGKARRSSASAIAQEAGIQ
jgi:hypothetical protein